MFRKRRKRKIKASRRKFLESHFARFLSLLFLSTGLVSLLVWGAFRLGSFFLSNSSYFNLSAVYLGDHLDLDGKDAFEFSGLKKGVNLFTLDLPALSKRIKDNHPEYEEVIVRRILPSTIALLLRERRPVFQIKLVKFYPVDKDGFVIAYAKESPYSHLPVVIGIGPKEVKLNKFSSSRRIRKALELMRIIEEGNFPWRGNLAKINLTSMNDVSLFLDNGIEVKLGSSRYIERMRRLSGVLEEIRVRRLEPSFIDLRFKDVIISPK